MQAFIIELISQDLWHQNQLNENIFTSNQIKEIATWNILVFCAISILYTKHKIKMIYSNKKVSLILNVTTHCMYHCCFCSETVHNFVCGILESRHITVLYDNCKPNMCCDFCIFLASADYALIKGNLICSCRGWDEVASISYLLSDFSPKRSWQS